MPRKKMTFAELVEKLEDAMDALDAWDERHPPPDDRYQYPNFRRTPEYERYVRERGPLVKRLYYYSRKVSLIRLRQQREEKLAQRNGRIKSQ